MIKIIHLSTTDKTGGAARATSRLNTGLQQLHIDSLLYVASKNSSDASVLEFKPSRDLSNRVNYRLRHHRITRDSQGYQRPAGLEQFSTDLSPFGSDILTKLPLADVYNLHWVAGFADYGACVPALAKRAKLVWTLHDMNPFTGGCHYNDGCGRFAEQCGMCPQLGSSSRYDLSSQIWHRKMRAFSKLTPEQLHIVVPCQWMANEASWSTLLNKFPVTVIPYGIDTAKYAPQPPSAMRTVLGIPAEAHLILFVADYVDNRRKGISYLWEALSKISNPGNLFLVSVGNGEVVNPTRIPHIHLGAISSDRMLSALYSAADVFVIPSLQDNSPLTIIEALSCGTPVVGFDVGGIPDMVLPGVTGSLVPVHDSKSLREAILALLNDPSRPEMSKRCRQFAVENLDSAIQAKAYSKLYMSLIQ